MATRFVACNKTGYDTKRAARQALVTLGRYRTSLSVMHVYRCDRVGCWKFHMAHRDDRRLP